MMKVVITPRAIGNQHQHIIFICKHFLLWLLLFLCGSCEMALLMLCLHQIDFYVYFLPIILRMCLILKFKIVVKCTYIKFTSYLFLSLQFISKYIHITVHPISRTFLFCQIETIAIKKFLISPPPAPCNHHSTLYFYEFDYSKHFIYVE